MSITFNIHQLSPQRMSSLGWPSDLEQIFGVDKDHTEMSMYPDRSSTDDYLDKFMSVLSQLVNKVVPESTRPGWAKQEPFGEQTWTLLDEQVILESGKALKFPCRLMTAPIIHTKFVGPIGLVAATDLMIVAEETAPTVRIPCFVTTPYEQNPEFVGRQEILDEIHRNLNPIDETQSQRLFALTGLGGMGKTQIAVQYAYAHRQEYPIVLWAHADGQAKLAQSFGVFAAELGLGQSLLNVKAKQAVKDCLKNSGEYDAAMTVFRGAKC